jgi:hypothetical protein
MICFTKPVLTEDLYIVQKEEFSITCYMCDTLDGKSSISIRDKSIFLSERMLHKNYDHKGSVVKTSLVVSRGLTPRQSDVCEPPVIK